VVYNYRKESLDKPYLEQQTKASLPNKELYLEKNTLCRKIERTGRLQYSKHEVMKRAERLHSSSTIGKVLLRTGGKKECELHGRLRTYPMYSVWSSARLTRITRVSLVVPRQSSFLIPRLADFYWCRANFVVWYRSSSTSVHAGH